MDRCLSRIHLAPRAARAEADVKNQLARRFVAAKGKI
jgi:hypothetical protein